MAQAAFWPKAPFFHWNRWICFDTFFPNCSLNYFVCIVSLGRTTAESLTNQNEVEVQRRCEERQQEIGHMQEILETKIQLLQEVHIVFLCAINWPHYDDIHISSIYYLKQFCCSWFIILVCFEANSALRDSIQNRVYFILHLFIALRFMSFLFSGGSTDKNWSRKNGFPGRFWVPAVSGSRKEDDDGNAGGKWKLVCHGTTWRDG